MGARRPVLEGEGGPEGDERACDSAGPGIDFSVAEAALVGAQETLGGRLRGRHGLE